jgi:hypothetical protein
MYDDAVRVALQRTTLAQVKRSWCLGYSTTSSLVIARPRANQASVSKQTRLLRVLLRISNRRKMVQTRLPSENVHCPSFAVEVKPRIRIGRITRHPTAGNVDVFPFVGNARKRVIFDLVATLTSVFHRSTITKRKGPCQAKTRAFLKKLTNREENQPENRSNR